jgi:hypothetical protein
MQMPGSNPDAPLYARLNVTTEAIRGQILETGRKKRVNAIESLFKYELYYYPFYLFLAVGTLSRRFLLNPRRESVFCVDGINGYYARTLMLLSPEVCDADAGKRLKEGAVSLPPLLNEVQAWEKGVEGLRRSHSISFAAAFWLDRRVTIEPAERQLLYKPYWRIEITSPQNGRVYIRVVDATSGETGGQNGYRFRQGLERVRPEDEK